MSDRPKAPSEILRDAFDEVVREKPPSKMMKESEEANGPSVDGQIREIPFLRRHSTWEIG